MTGRSKVPALAGGVVLVAGAFAYNSIGIANDATRYHLRAIGSSIYEYHSVTGEWPMRLEDLARTSLPQRSPHWERMLNDEAFVVLWHNNLKPDPQDNAARVLVYHNRGLLASFGRVWACWGDLQVKYTNTEQLRAGLENPK